MKLTHLPLALLVVSAALTSALGQDSPAAVLERQEQEERFNRLAGLVEDLREAVALELRERVKLEAEVVNLRQALRDHQEKQSLAQAGFLTREDLKKVNEKLQEIDKSRETDRKHILEKMDDLGKLIASTPVQVAPPKARREEEPKATNPPKNATPLAEEVFPHKVADGENLSMIINAYNSAFKQQGKGTINLEMVKRSNPKINVDRIYVGQEILIPAPPK